MAEVSFRYSNADLLKAAAQRRGLALSAYMRSLADAALNAEGFSTATETQYALVSNGELIQSPGGNVITTFRPAATVARWQCHHDLSPRGEWLPIENEDSEPFDAARHWRLKPLPLRVDGDRVVRTYPVIAKCQEHA